MKIFNLEYVETLPSGSGVETPRKVSGGFVFIEAFALASAQGSERAMVMTVTQTWAFKFPI